MTPPSSQRRSRSEQALLDSTEASSSTELEHLSSQLSSVLAPFVGAGRALESFGEQKVLVDATKKFLMRDDAGKVELIVLCSAAGGPEIVARNVQRAREAVDALGADLGMAVLLPVYEGDFEGRTFAVFSYCTPLVESGPRWWIQRSVVRPRLLRWLLDSSRRTAIEVSEEQLESAVTQPLEKMMQDEGHSPALRELAHESLRAVRARAWHPKHVLVHGDLWAGNVLIDQRSPGGSLFGRLVIIDWAGSQVRGYPFYDLLRLSCSFGLSGRRFFRTFDEYCAAIGYDRAQGHYAFAATAAELGERLEHWPRSSYLSTIERCYRKMVSGR